MKNGAPLTVTDTVPCSTISRVMPSCDAMSCEMITGRGAALCMSKAVNQPLVQRRRIERARGSVGSKPRAARARRSRDDSPAPMDTLKTGGRRVCLPPSNQPVYIVRRLTA